MVRVARPKEDLEQELRDQIGLLRMACASFDQGFEAAGKHISISLRVLLHHKNRSRALLEQLGLRTGDFVDSAQPLNPNNLIGECGLVGATISGVEARYIPLSMMGGGPHQPRLMPFTPWWITPIMKDAAGKKFSRLDLVSNVADTDGGGHVDPELDQQYAEMSRIHKLGWNAGVGPMDQPPKPLPFNGRIELACMRQIGWEVLQTLSFRAPKFAA